MSSVCPLQTWRASAGSFVHRVLGLRNNGLKAGGTWCVQHRNNYRFLNFDVRQSLNGIFKFRIIGVQNSSSQAHGDIWQVLLISELLIDVKAYFKTDHNNLTAQGNLVL